MTIKGVTRAATIGLSVLALIGGSPAGLAQQAALSSTGDESSEHALLQRSAEIYRETERAIFAWARAQGRSASLAAQRPESAAAATAAPVRDWSDAEAALRARAAKEAERLRRAAALYRQTEKSIDAWARTARKTAKAPARAASAPAASARVRTARADAATFASDAQPPKSAPPLPPREKPRTRVSEPSKAGRPAKPSTPSRPSTKGVITIASWGGAYQQSQNRALFAPFAKATGIRIRTARHTGTVSMLEKLASVWASWDVADVSSLVAEEGCRKGLLEPIDTTSLAPAPDAAPPDSDFLPGALTRCAVASVAWSSLIVYDNHRFAKRRPSKLRDFFDIKRFPGKRAMPRGPRYALEMALMADGVAREDVYDLLATEEGLARAFAMLERIREHVVWWTRPEEALALLARGEVAMAVAFSGRVFKEIGVHSRPWSIIWDGQIYDLDYWVIPKGAASKREAMRFIAFATRPDRLAEQTRWFPYGPLRRSALKDVGRHPVLGIDMVPFLPTAPENLASALRLDRRWWHANEPRLKRRFAAWLAGSDSETGRRGAPRRGDGT